MRFGSESNEISELQGSTRDENETQEGERLSQVKKVLSRGNKLTF